ncbi:MAG TPA: hypothetical protein PKE45_22705, partial [Caldilineaceae bacterium]|nr:hypothetical protein [Caldilineaceae bacterium]
MRAILRRWPPKQRYATFAMIVIFSLMTPLVWPQPRKSTVEAMMLGQARTDIAPLPPSNNQSGLQMTLSEGAQQLTTTTMLTVAPAEPLPAADTAALLERLPPLQVAVTDTQEFRLPT